jgi:hypothetical protein
MHRTFSSYLQKKSLDTVSTSSLFSAATDKQICGSPPPFFSGVRHIYPHFTPFLMDSSKFEERKRREFAVGDVKQFTTGALTGLVISCVGTCLLKHVTEGKMAGTDRRRRRRK